MLEYTRAVPEATVAGSVHAHRVQDPVVDTYRGDRLGDLLPVRADVLDRRRPGRARDPGQALDSGQPLGDGTGDNPVPRLTRGHRDRLIVDLDALVAQQQNRAREPGVRHHDVAATGKDQERVGVPYQLGYFFGIGRDDQVCGGTAETQRGQVGQFAAVRVHATTLGFTLSTTQRRGRQR